MFRIHINPIADTQFKFLEGYHNRRDLEAYVIQYKDEVLQCKNKLTYINVTNLNAKFTGISKSFWENDLKA